VVVVDANSGLAIGAHRFSLTVVDDSGNESQPALIDVIVQDQDRPTAVLDVVDASGNRLNTPLPAGRAFRLSGARSTDTSGRIVEYRFTLLPRA
jgi:hypothetical protein